MPILIPLSPTGRDLGYSEGDDRPYHQGKAQHSSHCGGDQS
jgi:hypothetical protein